MTDPNRLEAVNGPPLFPWYALVSGPEPEQGDILLECPRYSVTHQGEGGVRAVEETVSAIVLTQSCDMAFHGGNPPKLAQAVLARFVFKAELANTPLGAAPFWNEVIAGRRPRYHAPGRLTVEGGGQADSGPLRPRPGRIRRPGDPRGDGTTL